MVLFCYVVYELKMLLVSMKEGCVLLLDGLVGELSGF